MPSLPTAETFAEEYSEPVCAKPSAYTEVSENTLVDDTFGARQFGQLMGEHIVLDSGQVYVFDETTGIWSSDDKIVSKMITLKGDRLVFTKKGKVVANFSGSVKMTAKLQTRLSDVVPRYDGCIRRRFNVSRWNLLFKDGVYDLNIDSFTHGFSPNLVFHHNIPMNFPTQRNQGAIDFVRKTLFVEPFEKPEIGEVLLHFLCRALFGDNRMKKMLVCIGKGNSGMGTLCNFLSAVFGQVVCSFDGDCLLARGGLGGARSMSWVKHISTRRFAFCNGISVFKDKPRTINGNILKMLSSGGEGTTPSAFNSKEEVVNRAIPALFLNDLPSIRPLDYTLRSRLITVPYSYSFVETPTQPIHKLADPNLKQELMKQENLEAFIVILIDTMKGWDMEEIVLPEECKALMDEDEDL